MANTSPRRTPGAFGPEQRGGPYYRPETEQAGPANGPYQQPGGAPYEQQHAGYAEPGRYQQPYQDRGGYQQQGYAPPGYQEPVTQQQPPAHRTNYERGDYQNYRGPEQGPGQLRSWEELAVAEDDEAWRARTRVFLTPIAAPSIMGLFGFMIATAMVGAWQAGWYGTATTPLILFPFAFMAGGVLQSVAAFFAFRARDGVAVAAHTAWGSFWMGWAVLQLLAITHALPAIALGSTNASFGMWWVVLTVVTMSCAFGASAQSTLMTIVLGTLAAGSALTAVGFFAGTIGIERAGGWLFVVSAAAAWLTASAMTLENAFGRTIIPLGKWSKAANVPGRRATRPLQYPAGMPGVRVGQ